MYVRPYSKNGSLKHSFRFHLEAFVAQVMSMIKTSLEGMDWDF